MKPAEQVIAFAADGLHVREWCDDDAHEMSRLFDTEQMNRWTPLPSPFTPEVALAYVEGAHDARRRNGTLHLAVCAGAGGPVLGEVILFPTEVDDTVELAYAVGAEHQRRRVATRAVAAALDLASRAGKRRARLTISVDNAASRGTATAAGFLLTDEPLRRRERKGFVLHMETWERSL